MHARYVPPEEVKSPKSKWILAKVLIAGSEKKRGFCRLAGTRKNLSLLCDGMAHGNFHVAAPALTANQHCSSCRMSLPKGLSNRSTAGQKSLPDDFSLEAPTPVESDGLS